MQKILFVEPDKALGAVYKKYFLSRSYDAYWEQSADDAIGHIDKDCPDVLVLELQIPLHNGLELLYEIRSYPEWADLRVIINTNVPESKLLKSPVYNLLKVSKYIYKPESSLNDIEEAIKTTLA